MFIATGRFDLSNGKKWENYCEWAKIPDLTEIVSLDTLLCPNLIEELQDEDWNYIVCEDLLYGAFSDLEYLKKRVETFTRKNILGLYRNPKSHINKAPGVGNFSFIGYDLIEDATRISALTNCGGFPKAFNNSELNPFGLIDEFDHSDEVKRLLVKYYPDEPHAQCDMYAIWRFNE